MTDAESNKWNFEDDEQRCQAIEYDCTMRQQLAKIEADAKTAEALAPTKLEEAKIAAQLKRDKYESKERRLDKQLIMQREKLEHEAKESHVATAIRRDELNSDARIATINSESIPIQMFVRGTVWVCAVAIVFGTIYALPEFWHALSEKLAESVRLIKFPT